MSNMIETKDFKLINADGRQYVFLTGRQQVMEITTPQMYEYFMTAARLVKPSLKKEVLAMLRLPGAGISRKESNELTRELTELRDSVKVKYIPYNRQKHEQVMLILNTTHGCNMACRYCFASTDEEKQRVMTAEVARRSIENQLALYPEAKRYLIYFFGGEPLLHKRFIKNVVAMTKEIFNNKPDKSYGFMINTNGLLLDDDEMPAFFKDNGFCVTVSLDGPEEINDRNRVLTDGSGSFRRVMAGVEALRKAGVRFNLRATISPHVENLPEVFLFFENMKVDYSYAFTLTATKKDEKETKFSAEALQKLRAQYAEVVDMLTHKIMQGQKVYSMDFNEKLSLLEHRVVKTYGCEAGRSTLIVDENGTYYPCQNMLPMNFCIGDIENGINKLARECNCSQPIDDLRECRGCWARYLCGGGCQAERRRYKWDFPREAPQHCIITLFEWELMLQAYIKIKEAQLKQSEI